MPAERNRPIDREELFSMQYKVICRTEDKFLIYISNVETKRKNTIEGVFVT